MTRQTCAWLGRRRLRSRHPQSPGAQAYGPGKASISDDHPLRVVDGCASAGLNDTQGFIVLTSHGYKSAVHTRDARTARFVS